MVGALTLRDSTGEWIAIASLAPLLLVVAIWNGFPIIYYDTGAYILEGLGGVFLAERSPVYSLFLLIAGAKLSLWLVVGVQALIVAFVMTETARAIAPRLKLGWFLGIAAVLIVLTGLPWYVGEIEPDCLTAVVVLSIYLLSFHEQELGTIRRTALVAVAGLSAAAHPSHLLLGAGLFLMLAVYRLAVRCAKKATSWPKAKLASPLVVLMLGFSLILASNFAFTREIFFSRAGPDFFFSRLVQDRIVMRLLDDTCPQSGYRLCAYRSVLPPTADGWLWGRDSPFQKLGRFAGTTEESEKMIWDSMKRYPLLHAQMALFDAARQFATFKTGDQIEPQEWILFPALDRFIPAQMSAYMNARQQRGQMVFGPINLLHVPAGWLSLAGLLAAFGLAIRRGKNDAGMFLGLILAALIGNAVICGALSNPHARYQSRLIWLAPFALALVVGGRGLVDDHLA